MAQGYQAGAAHSIYRIDRTGFDQDVAHIMRQFDRIGQRARQPLPAPRLPTAPGAPAGGGAGGGSPRTAPDQSAQLQRQADAALRLAQAQARLAQAEGDTTRATTILNTALAANTNASERASLAVQTQAARLHHAGTQVQQGTSYFRQFGQSASSSLLSVVGPAAAATTAIALLKAGFDSIGESLKFKADLDSTTAGINSQLNGVRDIGQTWNQAQAFANRYKLTQAELNATLQASTQTLRTTKSSVSDVLTTLSLLQTKDTSKPISEAARALRELESGDTTSIKELFNISARDANKMKAEIQAGGDAVQVLRTYLEASGASLDALKAKTTGLAGALADVRIAEENVKAAEAQLAAGPGLTGLDIKARALTGLSRLLSGDFSTAGQSIGSTFQGVIGQAETYRETLQRTGSQTTAFITAWNGMNEAAAQAAAQHQAAATSMSAAGQAINQAMSATTAHTAALQTAASAITNNTVLITDQNGQLTQMAAVTQAAAQQSLLDSEAKALQGQQTQVLQAQTRLAADTFMQLHPNINASGVASLVMANQLNPLIGQLVVVRLRAQEAQAALLAVANAQNAASVKATVDRNRATGGGLSSGEQAEREAAFARAAEEHNKAVAAGVEQTNKRLDAQADAYKKVRDAQEQQALATGSIAQQQAVLNARLERARVTYGAQSEEFVNAETALIRFQQQQDKAATKGSKGGGGVKLTDQERLNNKLLANEDAYQNKTEDEARRHAENLLKIERDFQTRSLEQQRLNETGKRASRFEFYRSLTQAGKELGEGEAQAYSAAYEQAFAESQKLAQDGQNKLAADRLSLRQKQIQEDIEAAKAIRAAEEEGDTKRAESLRALEALRKDSQAEELKQLEARGDAIANDRAKAITDEQQRFDQANSQNEQSATRKADSVVTAAEREKKAIGGVNDMLAKQNDLYARSPARPVAIGEAASTSTPVGSTPAPTAAPAPAPASAGAAAAGLMPVIDAAVVGAIENQTTVLGGKLDAVVDRLRAVEGAIGRLSGGFQ